MSKLENKIEARHRNLFDVLNEQKYTVDYFQREYSWGEKHIEELVTDLTSGFLSEYTPGDKREQGEQYNNYYLGPFVVSSRDGKRSIIDGQQRLTSLTLFLIYLNNLQKDLKFSEKIEPMIFSELRGSKSFNITVEERIPCLEGLFNQGEYVPSADDDESTSNMAERYQDIARAFPDELKNDAFPFFIDWLRYNVIMVEIIAYSDENAYTMYSLVKEIRGKELLDLQVLLGQKLHDMKESFSDMGAFRMHGQNKRFVKFLLARITAWCELQAGMGTNFVTYYQPTSGKPFEVEHIWADKFSRHKDEFEQEHEFQNYRNRLGDLVLLPRCTNQSYGDQPYEQKKAHYVKENLLVKSLCPLAYENNPNFLKLQTVLELPFRPHDTFKKEDVETRQELYQLICERIWPDNLADTEMA